MPRHTVSASVTAPGWVTVKRGDTTVVGFWSWELRSVYAPTTGEEGSHLTFKGGHWLRTSATPDDVLVALGAASKIWIAVDNAKTRKDGLPSDLQDSFQTRDVADRMPPSDFDVTRRP